MKFASALFLLCSSFAAAQEQPIILRAGTVLDGKGAVRHNAAIVVQNGKIQRIDAAGGTGYDLRNMTVLPGLIDTHVHIAWHFGPDGLYQPRDDSQVTALGLKDITSLRRVTFVMKDGKIYKAAPAGGKPH